MRLRPYGPEAWLADDLEDPAGWAAGVRRAVAAGRVQAVTDVVPAEASVLVTCTRAAAPEVGKALAHVVARRAVATDDAVTIDVVYDGPDLAEVAAVTGCTTDDVVERHTRADYRVLFCGFSPGFAYLAGLDRRLHLARRESPRPSVPAGSVAIAAHYSAVYPSTTPGGWHLLGTTSTRVWNAAADPPALLTPGTRVRFRSVA